MHLATRCFLNFTLFSRIGDYNRYLAKFATDDKRMERIGKSRKAYEYAWKYALQHLPCMHEIRLSIALNFSILYEEIGEVVRAYFLTIEAFPKDEPGWDKLSTESCMIMLAMQDNLEIWVSAPLRLIYQCSYLQGRNGQVGNASRCRRNRVRTNDCV